MSNKKPSLEIIEIFDLLNSWLEEIEKFNELQSKVESRKQDLNKS